MLSQEEVDALLQGIGGDDAPPSEEAGDDSAVRSYDLASQERIVRGRMPAMEIIGERFARNLRVGLFNLIRKSPEVSIGAIKVHKYNAFLRQLVMPTNLNIISLQPLRGSGLVVCEPSLVFAVIDALFGGAGKFHTRIEGRDFSATEQRVILRLVETILHRVQVKAWHGIYPLELTSTSARRCSRSSPTSPRPARSSWLDQLHAGDRRDLRRGALLHPLFAALEPIRDALLYSTHPGRLGRAGPALDQPAARTQIQSAAGGPGGRTGPCAPATVEQLLALQARRLRRTGPAEPIIKAKVDGVPVFDCHLRHGQQRPLRHQASTEPITSSKSRAGWENRMSAEDNAAPADEAQDADGGRVGRRARTEPRASRPRWRPTCAPAPTAWPPRSSPTSLSSLARPAPASGNDISMILDIPVQLTVELGRTRIPIKHILQLAQGSVVELETLAGEPMDVLVNGFLIAQGEVVVVNDKFGIRLTDIVTPSERCGAVQGMRQRS